jgi:hypothetical protein
MVAQLVDDLLAIGVCDTQLGRIGHPMRVVHGGACGGAGCDRRTLAARGSERGVGLRRLA